MHTIWDTAAWDAAAWDTAAWDTAPGPDDEGGWTTRRREVIDDAAGVCTRCGLPGADTATRGWDVTELVAAHTRCVVGLAPPLAGRLPVAA